MACHWLRIITPQSGSRGSDEGTARLIRRRETIEDQLALVLKNERTLKFTKCRVLVMTLWWLNNLEISLALSNKGLGKSI